MKFIGIIAIVSAFAVVTSAVPVSKTGKSLEIQPDNSAAKSGVKAAGVSTTTKDSDAEEMVNSIVDKAIESSAVIPFYITAPKKTDIFGTGDIVTTSWYNGIEGRFLINVIQGPDPFDMQPTDIFMEAYGENGYFEWTIPKDLPSGSYGFKYIYTGSDGRRAESYSVPFKVIKFEQDVNAVDTAVDTAVTPAVTADTDTEEVVKTEKTITTERVVKKPASAAKVTEKQEEED